MLKAYCEIGDFFYSNSVTNLMEPKKRYREEDFSFVNLYLAPEAMPNWDKAVAGAIRGEAKGTLAVNGLLYFNLKQITDAGYTFPTDADDLPLQGGGGVSKATTSVTKFENGREALAMYFTVTNNIIIKDKAGKVYGLPLTRKIGVYLTQSKTTPGHEWLMNSWNTSYKSDDKLDYEKLKADVVTTGE